jgi:hypothetical protein
MPRLNGIFRPTRRKIPLPKQGFRGDQTAPSPDSTDLGLDLTATAETVNTPMPRLNGIFRPTRRKIPLPKQGFRGGQMPPDLHLTGFHSGLSARAGC